MSGLAWKLNRIKAMSLGEILFRAGRSFQVGLERRRVNRGWRPLPREAVVSGAPLFAEGLETVQAEWNAQFGVFDSTDYAHTLGRANLFENFDVDISGRIDWHRDPESGIVAPLEFGKDIDYRDNAKVGNCKTLWELSRHKHLVPIAVAYAMSGESRFVDKLVEQTESWIAQNPFGKGVHWCSSLEVALRLIAWALCHGLVQLRHKDGLFDVVKKPEALSEAIYQHVYFIVNYLSRYSSANNHLIGELTGIWVGCNVFDLSREGDQWAAFAKRELAREAKLQVFADGVSREQATYYHLWVLEYFLLCWLVGERYNNPLTSAFRHAIGSMAQFLLDLKPRGGDFPQIGDADDGVVASFHPDAGVGPYENLLSAVVNIGQCSHSAIGRSTAKAFWYGAIRPKEVSGSGAPLVVEATESVTVYPDGGYVILRGADTHLVFDAGSLGYPSIAAHGHADALSFILALKGEWWLVDPGTYVYHTEEIWRNYFRGTKAHNTVCINDKDQSLIGGAFLWLKHARSELLHEGAGKDGEHCVEGRVTTYGGEVHRRKLCFNEIQHCLRIEDVIVSNNPTPYALNFNFHPDLRLERVSEDRFVASKASSDVQLEILLDKRLQWSLHQGETTPPAGWYSETLGIKMPAPMLHGLGHSSTVSEIVTTVQWRIGN